MCTVVGIRSDTRVASSTKQPPPTVWFGTWRQLAGVLSDENRPLLRLMHERKPRTVLELAELSGRAASNLSCTLRAMEGYGLVRLNRNPETRSVRPEALATEFLVLLD